MVDRFLIYGYGIAHLLVALLCGASIGMVREKAGAPAGLKTHTVVAMGSSMIIYVMVSLFNEYGGSDSIARVMAGVIQGITFLGSGLIIRDGEKIAGLTSAATIWYTSIIGMISGTKLWFFAIIITLMYLVVIYLESKYEKAQEKK